MKRVTKHPDVRRTEIMLAAEKLFKKMGYANTSVESIIKKVGIAKGTFYYYFKTKQDILNALVERISSEMKDHYQSIIDQTHLSAIEKFKLMIRGPEKP